MLDQAPQDIRAIFAKAGEDWTPGERSIVKIWLNTPPQIGELLRYTALNLGSGTSGEDVVETWKAFVADELDRTIETFDPSRSPFKAWLLLLLKQHCWRAGKLIRRRREVPLDPPGADGQVTPLAIADPTGETEQQRVDRLDLQRCMASIPPHYREVLERYYFEGKSVGEIAEDICISEAHT